MVQSHRKVDGDVNINAVKYSTGDALLIFCEDCGGTSARFERVTPVSTWTGIH